MSYHLFPFRKMNASDHRHHDKMLASCMKYKPYIVWEQERTQWFRMSSLGTLIFMWEKCWCPRIDYGEDPDSDADITASIAAGLRALSWELAYLNLSHHEYILAKMSGNI